MSHLDNITQPTDVIGILRVVDLVRSDLGKYGEQSKQVEQMVKDAVHDLTEMLQERMVPGIEYKLESSHEMRLGDMVIRVNAKPILPTIEE